jgi:acyl transferase domain-containing protein/acyl carrier protein
MTNSTSTDRLDGSEIAIIGMACRFPQAKTVEEFWKNLCDARECVTFLKDEEIEPSLVDPAVLSNLNYVRAASLLEDIDMFDASFFGFTPREAELMDPQHRVFLECAWEALEDAGYDPTTYEKAIGLFAGARTDTYIFNLFSNRDEMASLGAFEIGLGNDSAFLSTRVSYKLNLRGPSYSVHTACSTSLVAVHLACQSLLIDECQMALAGGVAINIPQKTGYIYRQGSYASPDGRTRTFDAKAQGTLFGSGVGILTLKRLEDAIADGDSVHAVIKGSAVNNDGFSKASFTAPSVNGQKEVILEAMANAGVEADTISYVEAHGTGTPLGDPIEIRALTKAFRATTDANNFCAIGSVKTNIGHLDAAAGVASMIKATLMLKHRLLPPSLNFEAPNPNLDLERSPFYVNAKLTEWNCDKTPRRLGVSSFGVGGTNSHVILEEAPTIRADETRRPWQLILQSARSESALEKAGANLAAYLKKSPDLDLADVAFTLKIGRKHFSHKRMLVCRDLDEAVTALESPASSNAVTDFEGAIERPVAFMFPGGGAQYVGMGGELYQSEPTFREQVDLCSEILESRAGYFLRDYLFHADDCPEEASKNLKRPSIALPALFVIEYALAKLWMSWGVRPDAMIGHSLGEYVAACLAEVFSLNDALSLVFLRGQLIEGLPPGAMVSVSLSEKETRSLIDESLSVAAVNAPSQCVVSGSADAINKLVDLLTAKNIEFRRLHIDAPGHSDLVTPILDTFAEFVERIRLNTPMIPYVSNVTGTWIKNEEATDPKYWGRHLRQTVRFADGLDELMKNSNRVLLEVGPGQTLNTLVKLQTIHVRAHPAISSMRHPADKQSDEAVLLTALGKLWLAGVSVEWMGLYANQRRRRLSLPTYPFERHRYWIAPGLQADKPGTAMRSLSKRANIAEWFYIPSWTRSLTPGPFTFLKAGDEQRWLALVDESGFGMRIAERLESESQLVVSLVASRRFEKISPHRYALNPTDPEDYRTLVKELQGLDLLPTRIVHTWSITTDDSIRSGAALFERMNERGYYSLLFLAQALSEQSVDSARILVVSNRMLEVSGEETICPEKATVLGPCKVIPQEAPNIACRCIDISIPEPHSAQERQLVDHILSESAENSLEVVVAYRGNQRWIQKYEPIALNGEDFSSRYLREDGVYLITGGLGGVGLMLAEYLARTLRANLILTRRSDFPDKEQWADWLAIHSEHDQVSKKIHRLQRIERAAGALRIIHADVTDEAQMRLVLERIDAEFGRLNGVLHTAGVTSGSSVYKSFLEIGRTESETQFQPKGYGLYTLEKVLKGRDIDICLLFSSNASILGGLGFITYSAVNQFMDHFAISRNKTSQIPWISANWDPWPEETKKYSGYQTSLDQYTMTPEEGEEAFRRVVCMAPEGQIAIATGDLAARLNLYINRAPASGPSPSLHPRPDVKSVYLAPETETERIIADVWRSTLGLETVGVNDNFFDLGGHSLLASRVISQLRDAFQMELPISKLFEAPTVGRLAKVVTDLKAQCEDQEKMEILNMLVQLSEEEVEAELNKRTDPSGSLLSHSKISL